MVVGDQLDASVRKNVEFLKDDGSFVCNLPDHPLGPTRHTQNGLVTCGFPWTSGHKICYSFANGTWAQSHTLQRKYVDASSWESSKGIVLLSRGTTDLLTETGSVDHFSLRSSDSAR